MVAGAVWTQTSYRHGPVDASYPHGVVAIRAFDGEREDPVFRNSLRTAQKLVSVNRLLAVIAELGYRPGDQVSVVEAFRSAVVEHRRGDASLAHLDGLRGPARPARA